jgi:hypothetical protein
VSSHNSQHCGENRDREDLCYAETNVAEDGRPFVVVTSDELRDTAIGLRIFDCFSPQRPTLTTAEISEIVHAQAQDVIRHAERLARTGYLQADSSSGESAWTMIADER